MATLSIGKSHFTVGANSDHYSEAENQARAGFFSNLSLFMSSAQEVADKYADYKYTQTDWRAIRP
ncbi:MAG: hypothetical protein IH872_06560 [Chloroflexi bacterium]|nr:hypothetical protein [Chloroflexota bacterium]